MKKFFVFIAFVISALIPITVYASDFDKIHIEQVNANLPEVTAYLYLEDGDGNIVKNFEPDKDAVTVVFGGESVEIVDFSKHNNEETAYYYLLDVSTSVQKSVFNEVKEMIKNHINTKEENEKIIVITFGKEVKVVLDGSENSIYACEKVDSMQPNETATRLFDGLDKMLTLSANDVDSASRKIAVLVSDGADLYNGGATKDEVLERIQKENIALFSFALPNSGNDGKEAMRSFSEKSGGKQYILKSSKVAENFNEFNDRIDNCLVLQMKSDNNIVKSTSEDLVIKIPYENTVLEATFDVKTTKWIKDEISPEIVSCKAPAMNKLEIEFSENVSGADNLSNYRLFGEDGTEYGIISVSFNKESFIASVILEGDLYNGEYSVNISGVSDVSMEKNIIEESDYGFTVSEEGRDRPLTVIETLLKYWYISLPLFIMVAAGIVLAVIMLNKSKRKSEEKKLAAKKQEEENIRKAALNAVEEGLNNSAKAFQNGNIRIDTAGHFAKRVMLVINEEGEMQRSVDVLIRGKYTMGRSSKCNLSFNDKGMSREHCAFDYINGTLVIQDLGSTNGTTVNGIGLKGPYCVNDGDVIKFGRTKITVRFL